MGARRWPLRRPPMAGGRAPRTRNASTSTSAPAGAATAPRSTRTSETSGRSPDDRSVSRRLLPARGHSVRSSSNFAKVSTRMFRNASASRCREHLEGPLKVPRRRSRPWLLHDSSRAALPSSSQTSSPAAGAGAPERRSARSARSFLVWASICASSKAISWSSALAAPPIFACFFLPKGPMAAADASSTTRHACFILAASGQQRGDLPSQNSQASQAQAACPAPLRAAPHCPLVAVPEPEKRSSCAAAGLRRRRDDAV
mmetsp:Transcript_14976/g.44681  ORF Transcript_14976/g.44681 Transcript_14976/m.44681 type:complete len:258 (-) Transcript_14976:263-1036(-)